MVIIGMFRHFTEHRKSPGGQIFDRWQQFLKTFFSEKCSDFHENLPVSQFLRVESISEVCFAKKLIPGKIPGNGFFGRFLEFLKICMENQMQITWNYSEMYISYVL